MLKQRVIDAYNFAQTSHNGQKRKYTNYAYFTHPKGVARLIDDLTRDEDMIIAALLHDVVEDCRVTVDTIRSMFGNTVAFYVDNLTSDKAIIQVLGKEKYLQQKMTDMSLETLVIKLADRLDNVRYMDKDCKTLQHKQFVQKYYNETKAIIAYIKEHRSTKDLTTEPIEFLIAAIELELKFLKIKYMW